METAKDKDSETAESKGDNENQEQPLTEAEGLEKNTSKKKKKLVPKIRLFDDLKNIRKAGEETEEDKKHKEDQDNVKNKEIEKKEEREQQGAEDVDKKKSKGKYMSWWRSDEAPKFKQQAAEYKEIKAFATHVEPLFGLVDKYLSTTRKAQLAEEQLSEALKGYLAIGDPYVSTLSDRIHQLTPDTTALLEVIADCERTLKMVTYHCNKYIFMSEARKDQNFEELMMSKRIFIGMLAVYVLRVFATKRLSRGESAEDKILSAAQAYCECYNAIKSKKDDQLKKKKIKRRRRIYHTPDSKASSHSYHMSMEFEELQNSLPGVDLKMQISPTPLRRERQIVSPPLFGKDEQRTETKTPPLPSSSPSLSNKQDQQTTTNQEITQQEPTEQKQQDQQLLSPRLIGRTGPSINANLDNAETERRPSHRRTNSTNSIKTEHHLPNIHWKDCKVNPDASAREILEILNKAVQAFERNNDIYLLSREKQSTKEIDSENIDPTKGPLKVQRYSMNTKSNAETSESADNANQISQKKEPIESESIKSKEGSITKESKFLKEKHTNINKHYSDVSEIVMKDNTTGKYKSENKRDSIASETVNDKKNIQLFIDASSTGLPETGEEKTEEKEEQKKSLQYKSKGCSEENNGGEAENQTPIKRHKHRRGKSKIELTINEEEHLKKNEGVTIASLSEPKEDNTKPSQLFFLESFVKNPASFFFIQSFMMRSLTSENISFIQQALQYRDMSTEEERRFMLKKIYDTFLSHNAPYPINVSASAVGIVKDELNNTNSLLGRKESEFKRHSSDFSTSSSSLRESISTPQFLAFNTDEPTQDKQKTGLECPSPHGKGKRSDFTILSSSPIPTATPIKNTREKLDGIDPLFPLTAAYREITMLLILNRTKELFEGSVSAKMLNVFLTRNNAIAAEERLKREKEKELSLRKKKESKKGDDGEREQIGDTQNKRGDLLRTTDFLPEDKQESKDNRKEYTEKRKQILKQFKLKKLKERLFDQKKNDQEKKELSQSASSIFVSSLQDDSTKQKESAAEIAEGKAERSIQGCESDQTSTTSNELPHANSDESGSVTKAEPSNPKKHRERRSEKKKDRKEKEKKKADQRNDDFPESQKDAKAELTTNENGAKESSKEAPK